MKKRTKSASKFKDKLSDELGIEIDEEDNLKIKKGVFILYFVLCAIVSVVFILIAYIIFKM